MGKLIKGYYYFFYKIYKILEKTNQSDSRAFESKSFFSITFPVGSRIGLIIMGIEFWILILVSIVNYYLAITKEDFQFGLRAPVVYLPLLFLIFISYLSFVYTDKWKGYNQEFDELPKEKDRRGTFIVVGVLVLIISNLIFSFYLKSLL